MQIRFAVCNQKGGVAKSTTAVNLAAIYAKRGMHTLLVDYDPQGNASQFLGLMEQLEDPTIYTSTDLTQGKKKFAPMKDLVVKGLDLVPANESLAALEFDLLQDSVTGAHRLGTALSAVASGYDIVIIDCPPTLGMLAINALVGASNVLVPVKLSPASVPGAAQLFATLSQLKKINSYLRVIGVLGTFLNDSAKSPKAILKQLREIFGQDSVFDTAIHQAIAIDEASGKGKPVVVTAPKSRGALEYQSLADEVLKRV